MERVVQACQAFSMTGLTGLPDSTGASLRRQWGKVGRRLHVAGSIARHRSGCRSGRRRARAGCMASWRPGGASSIAFRRRPCRPSTPQMMATGPVFWRVARWGRQRPAGSIARRRGGRGIWGLLVRRSGAYRRWSSRMGTSAARVPGRLPKGGGPARTSPRCGWKFAAAPVGA